jgi:hypothetical protein
MKVDVTTASFVPAGRLLRRVRNELLSSHTVERFQRELEDELDAVSSSRRNSEDDGRRDALERDVRRIWGATL